MFNLLLLCRRSFCGCCVGERKGGSCVGERKGGSCVGERNNGSCVGENVIVV